MDDLYLYKSYPNNFNIYICTRMFNKIKRVCDRNVSVDYFCNSVTNSLI